MASTIAVSRWITYGFRYAMGMGLYGFTRGYRATHQWDSSTRQFVPHSYLIGDRIAQGSLTALFYAVPYTAPWTILNLVNRTEIYLRGWKPTDYPDVYRETGTGYCPTVL